MQPSLDEQFARAAELIAQADSLIIGAGAGMGVDSGLPDFRGRNGFWRAYPALGKRKIRFEDIADGGAKIVLRFFPDRLLVASGPNATAPLKSKKSKD